MPKNKKQTDNDKSQKNKKGLNPGGKHQYTFYWIVLAALFGFWLFSSEGGGLFGGPPTIDYSEFRQQIKSGNVQQVTIRGDQIKGEQKKKNPVTSNWLPFALKKFSAKKKKTRP